MSVKVKILLIVVLIVLTGCSSLVQRRADRIAAAVTASAVWEPGFEATATPQNKEVSTPTPNATRRPEPLKLPAQVKQTISIPNEIISLENLNRLQEIGVLGRGNLSSFAVFPNAPYLAAASTSGVLIISLTSFEEVLWLESEPVAYVKVSNDGRLVAADTGRGRILLWDTQEAKITREVEASSVAFHPFEDTIAFGSAGGNIWLENRWDRSNPVYLEGHTLSVNDLAFALDGKYLVSGSEDGSVRIWDPETAQFIGQMQGNNFVVDTVIVSPDGSKIAAGARKSNNIMVWEIGNPAPLHEYMAPSTKQSFTFLEDSDGLVVISMAAHSVGYLDVYLFSTEEKAYSIGGSTTTATGIGLAHSRNMIYVANANNEIALINMETSYQRASYRNHPVYGSDIVFSNDGNKLFYSSAVYDLQKETTVALNITTDMQIYKAQFGMDPAVLFTIAFAAEENDPGRKMIKVTIWNSASGLAERNRALAGKFNETMTISPNLAYAAADGRDITIWNLNKDDPLQPITVKRPYGTKSIYDGIWFSHDAKLVATSAYRSINIWDGTYFGLISRTDVKGTSISTMAISGDNLLLAVGQDNGQISLYNARGLSRRYLIDGHEGAISGIAFSPDKQVFLSFGEDNRVVIRKLSDGSELRVLMDGKEPIGAAAFSPDGNLIAIGMADGTVHLWGIQD